MLIRYAFYYEGKTTIEQSSEAFDWFVETLSEFAQPGNGKYVDIVSQDLTNATLANRYFNFTVNGSRRIQLSFPTTGVARIGISILKTDAPDEMFKTANNVKSTYINLPTNNTPVPVSIIISKYSFIINRGTVTIVQGFSAKHFSTDERIMLMDDKIIGQDEDVVYNTLNTSSTDTLDRSSAAILPAPSPSLAPAADTLASMPISFVGTTSPVFGFLGYFSEGLLRTSNRNGFVAYSLISVSGVRYLVSSNINLIYRVDD